MAKISIEFKYINQDDKTIKDCIIIEHAKAKEIVEAYNCSWMKRCYDTKVFISDMIHSFTDNILEAGFPEVLKVCYIAEGAAPMHSSGAKLSPAQEKFRAAFPDKKIDCDVPEGVEIDKIIQAVRERPFLQQPNITLKSCVRLYQSILAGGYKPFVSTQAPDKRNDFQRRDYTPEQLKAMFTRDEPFEYEV